MKFSLSKKSLSSLAILLALSVSVFLHTYKIDKLSLNEDEAAQGYNTYSVLQTGYDEYGRIPLRYLSFGENKLPLTGMLSAPFIALFGLNELTVRLPVLLLGILFPLFFYGATLSLTQSKRVAVVSCLLASTNTWLYTVSRHQHESVVLAIITLIIISLIYRYLSKRVNETTLNDKTQIVMKTITKISVLIFMGLYTYHSGKIIMPFLALVSLVFVWKYHKQKFNQVFIFIIVAFLIFGATEILQPNNRLDNLSYFTSLVFSHEIEEGRRLGGSTLYYNKVVYGAHRALTRTVGYLSPHFLLINSDPNPRYGSPQVRLLTIFAYVTFAIGLIFIWIKKHPARLFLTSLLLITILPAVAAFPTDSLTRSFVLTVPLLIVASIGATYIWEIVKSQKSVVKNISLIFLAVGVIIHLFEFYTSARAYFSEYLESSQTQQAWQSGTKELAEYVWENYSKFDTFYITREFGQPYIFLLFYKPYPPKDYQKVAKPGQYNEYGFWEQERFDKFVFRKPNIYAKTKRSAYIMTPEEVKLNNMDQNKLKEILHGGQVRFYVQENL
jgi:4-amino-4-deoxy-L-arabinose transferase-like glycosyltransferase